MPFGERDCMYHDCPQCNPEPKLTQRKNVMPNFERDDGDDCPPDGRYYKSVKKIQEKKKKMDNLFDIAVLQRKSEYYDGVEQRLGFSVRDGNAALIHVAGVSFNDRQALLKRIDSLCKFDRAPQMKLELEPDNQWDKYAIKVLVVTGFDDVTGSALYSHVGYIPKGRCPYCARTLSGPKAAAQICPDCSAEIGLSSIVNNKKTINKFITENFEKVTAGVDTVTKSGAANFGLDIWVRLGNASV